MLAIICCANNNWLQALNNLAETDENKQKIVDAGALPLYVKLLRPDCDETEQREASKGLWSLAFKCKEQVLKEPGCEQGQYITLLL